MNNIPTSVKYFLIIIVTFGLIYWFQSVDDKKKGKVRESIYDKIKLPLLVSCLVGLVLVWNNKSFTALFITSCVEEVVPATPHINLNDPLILSGKPVFGTHGAPKFDIFTGEKMTMSTGRPDFDVYTGLPEW